MRNKLSVLCALACVHGWTMAQVPQLPGTPAQAASPTFTVEDWVRANAEVGNNLRGHADLVQQEALDAGLASTPTTTSTLEANSAAAPLSLNQAMRLALKNQPQWRASATLNPLEKAALDQQVLLLSHRVHRAWIEAVAAHRSVGQLQEVWQAAQISAELAQRMVRVGNWSKAQATQALLAQAGAAQQLAAARLQAFSTRERLVRVLGASGLEAQFSLAPGLPALPASPLPAQDLEDTALRHNPALALARAKAARESLGVSAADLQAWPLAVVADLQTWPAPESASANELSPLPTHAPLRQRRVPAESHELDQAALAHSQAQALEADTRSLAREAYFRYRLAFDLARHQRLTVVALQTTQQEETQARYNGMLQSTWDLLASAQARLQSVNSALMAERDFWLAHTDLHAVLAGAVVSFSTEASAAGQATNAPQGH